jgi:4-diphosphocytidyl-2-C-methyl-D-erythritol kinase
MAVSEQFSKAGDGLLVRAPGKVNFSLLIAGKRADGYHDIETIMAKVNWYDEILIERQTEDRGQKTEDGTKNTEQRIQNTEQKAEDGGRENVQYPTSNVELRTNETPVIELICQGPNPVPEGPSFAEATEGGIVTRSSSGPDIELICKGEYKVPEGEDNLVYKAAKLILETARQKAEDRGQRTPLRPEGYAGQAEDRERKTEDGEQKTEDGEQRTKGIKITLTKNIPAGSGLGSGSSDAAATLMGINRFFKLGLGKKELAGLAAKLGSDVAFFLDGPMALCTGRGEKVKKLAECEFRALLIVPIVSVSTQRVYENYRHDDAKYSRLREEINVYIEKNRIDLICSMGANMLQESCFGLHPELGVLKKRIESMGVRPVCLSGSGSSMFCIINRSNEEGVKAYRDKFEQESGCKSIIVNNNSW